MQLPAGAIERKRVAARADRPRAPSSKAPLALVAESGAERARFHDVPSLIFFLVALMGEGQVVFDDFDFDGRQDFAVHRDDSGPYGSGTFDVYLQNASNRFVRSAPLSELTETTMGLFTVDPARKRLVTSAKSGCCFHVTEDLEVIGGAPRAVHRVTEDALTDEDHVITTVEDFIGGRWIERSRVSPR